MQADNDLLRDIPDFGPDFAGMEPWLNQRLAALAAEPFDAAARSSFVGLTMPADPESRRRFIAATLLADWACYEREPDRADFPRLKQVMTIFPRGFRLWLCRLADGQMTPVGYTGWYAIEPEVFQIMETRPETITHRGFMWPLAELRDAGNHVYVFNYSIVEPLRKTGSSRALLQTLARDVIAANPLTLSAVAVSEDGIRVARRFGMEITGTMVFMGETENVLTRRMEVAAEAVTPRPTQTRELA